MAFARMPSRLAWALWIPVVALASIALVVWLGWFATVFFATVGVAATVLRRRTRHGAGAATAGVLVNQSAHSVKATLARASNDELCELWGQSARDIGRAYLPSTVSSYADLRAMLLDELVRRDPLGVQRWLAEEPDRRDPRVYLNTDPR